MADRAGQQEEVNPEQQQEVNPDQQNARDGEEVQQLRCGQCRQDKPQTEYTEEEKAKDEATRRCNACAANTRMYACEEGKWRSCTLTRMNEDGTATIRRIIDDNEVGDEFQIVYTKLAAVDAAQLNQDHGQREPAGNRGEQHSGILATLLQQILQHRPQGANDYAKRLWHSNQLTKFSQNFPTNEAAFYRWTAAIEAFETANSEVPPDMIFKRVLESLKGATSAAWRRHRTQKYRDHLADRELEDDPNLKETYMKNTVDTLTELQTFAIKEIQVTPDMSFFQTQIGKFTAFRNEKPKDTLNRLEHFYFEYEILKKKLNPCIPMKLRSFRIHEKLDQIKRVFITDNNSPIHRNDSLLNSKIKTKVAKKVEALQKSIDDPDDETNDVQMYRDLVQYITENLTKEILPSLDEEQHQDGKHWIKYPSRSSFITTGRPKANHNPSSKKRRQYEVSQNPSKRRKYDDVPRCPDGANCRYILAGAECYKRHSASEMRAMRRAKRKSSKSTPRNTKQSPVITSSKPEPRKKRGRDGNGRFDSPAKKQRTNTPTQSGPSSGRNFKCRHGTQCSFWQQGRCNFQHFANSMKCAICGIPGHPSSACRKAKGTPSSKTTPQRYNVSNPNHSKMMTMQTPLNSEQPQFYTTHYHQNTSRAPERPPNQQHAPTYNQLALAKDVLEKAQAQYTELSKAAGIHKTRSRHNQQV